MATNQGKMMRICQLSARSISLPLQPRLHNFANTSMAAMQRSDTVSARFVEPSLPFKGTFSRIWRRACGTSALKQSIKKKENKLIKTKISDTAIFLAGDGFLLLFHIFYFFFCCLHYTLSGEFEGFNWKSLHLSNLYEQKTFWRSRNERKAGRKFFLPL